MPIPLTSSTFSTVYKDDFADSDNYHRVLFNSGRALQARELTQMQTIIQREMQRFANNIFLDGAAVSTASAEAQFDFDYRYIKLSAAGFPVGVTEDDLSRLLFEGQESGVKVRVRKAVNAENGDPATLYVRYESTPDPEFLSAKNGEELVSGAITLTVASADATGSGLSLFVGGGDFYVQGHFVFCPSQEIFLSKYTNGSDIKADIGYIVKQDIVTADDNSSLFDNQGAVPNRAAPGADRYRIRLELANKKEAEETGEEFVSLLSIANLQITKLKGGSTDFNEIENRMATRTKEESGNYLVNPFRIKFDEGNDETLLNLSANPFVAYVNGYRAEVQSISTIPIDKPFSTTSSEEYNAGSVTLRVDYRNYVNLDSAVGIDNLNFDLPQRQELNLYSGVAATGNVIGTINAQYIKKFDGIPQLYFFNMNINEGQSVRDTRSIGSSSSNYLLPALQDGNLYIKEAGSTNNFISLPYGRVSNVDVDNVSFEVQREFNVTSLPGGSVTITTAVSESFQDASEWIFINITDNVEEIVSSSNINLSTPQQATISGLTGAKQFKIFAYVLKTNVSAKAKVLTETTLAITPTTDSDSTYITLEPDVYDIIRVTKDDSDGYDLSNRFILDDGQRDNYYKPGRLTLTSGTLPSGDVFVRYRHLTRGIGGDFFCVNSYDSSEVKYPQIPTYTNSFGNNIRLTDVLDFRPTMSSDGTFSESNVFEIPKDGSTIQMKLSNYNSRVDVLTINERGVLSVKKGDESLDPKQPKTSEDVLPLYVVRYGARTLNSQDLSIQPIKHKRYSMRDIADLEGRINNLEKTTSLSLIETKTENLLITDDEGNIRSKSGFFVDNFRYFPLAVASENSKNFNHNRATQSVDYSRNLVYPRMNVNAIRLLFDSDNSVNVKRKGDMLYLDHVETVDSDYIQNIISNSINVNPFNVFTGEGSIKISPQADNWVEIRQLPDGVINGNELIAGNAAMNWWLHGWSGKVLPNGIDPDTVQTGDVIQERIESGDFKYEGYGDRTFRTDFIIIDTISAVRTIREVIGNRVVDTIFVPWMRNKLIHFKAEGLKPNTRYFPFFDEVDVSQWCREEESFLRTQDNQEDYGDVAFIDEHPNGSGTLISNTDGEIIGSFWLPNTGSSYILSLISSGAISITTQKGATSQEESDVIRDNYLAFKQAVIDQTGGDANSPAVFDLTGWKFPSGVRQFKLLDTSSSDESFTLSKARVDYVSSGTVDVKRKDISTTRQISVERAIGSRFANFGSNEFVMWDPKTWVDPIAQTFLVPFNKDQGIFVTSVEIYVKSAPSVDSTQIPLELQIRGVRDGSPMSGAVNPQARAFKTASSVRAAISGQDPESLSSVLQHPVKFEFEEPIYLPSNSEYAIVVLTDTDDYEVYISTTYEFLLGSTEKRVSKQTSQGSLFLSQNASTWSPDQNSDLAFRINVAKFKPSGTAKFYNAAVPRYNFDEPNLLSLDSGSNKLIVQHPTSGLIRGDKPSILGLTSPTAKYAGILGSSIMDSSNVIDSADVFGYSVLLDSSATSDLVFGGRDISALQNFMFDKVSINEESITPERTNVGYLGKFVSGISYANDVNVTNDDTRFDVDTFYRRIEPNTNYLFGNPKIVANSITQTEEMSGAPSIQLDANLSSSQNSLSPSGSYTSDISPIIDLQRITAICVSNLIDNQDSVATAGANYTNRPRLFTPETAPLSGTSLSKHITKPITLRQSAVGLRIDFTAHRPPEADFVVFYRTSTEDEDIYDSLWIELDPILEDPNIFGTEGTQTVSGYPAPNKLPTSEDVIEMSEYSYFAGDYFGTGLNDLSAFTQYQLKIVFNSTNTSHVPILDNIRTIAVAL